MLPVVRTIPIKSKKGIKRKGSDSQEVSKKQKMSGTDGTNDLGQKPKENPKDDPVGTGACNIEVLAPPLENPGNIPKFKTRAWFFTWNNYPGTFGTDLLNCFAKAKKYVFQQEVGKTGTPHIQGFVEWVNPVWNTSIQEQLPGIWIQKCRNMKASEVYCSKVDTKAGKTYYHGLMFKNKLIDPLEGLEYFWWQHWLDDIIVGPVCTRTMYWFWNEHGDNGKTTLARHLCIKYPKKRILYVNGSANNIKCAFAKMMEKGNPPEVVIWGIPKERSDYISYGAMEEIKDGIFFSGKFESGMCQFNPPHVIILANCGPNIGDNMSVDKFKVVDIEKETKRSATPHEMKVEKARQDEEDLYEKVNFMD